MTVSPLPISSMSAADLSSTADLARPSIDSALEDFEGIFISMMLKEMRKTAGKSFFGDDKADAIGGLFDMMIGEELGRQGGLGIVSALSRYREVAETNGPTPPSGEAT